MLIAQTISSRRDRNHWTVVDYVAKKNMHSCGCNTPLYIENVVGRPSHPCKS
ncbi:hypothetical protein [Mastigocoleus sp. MO_188.B34]|uniref:hypothetical protein n=1 Tax=Mastigocoleus sp. MO_188.B34 TaxID=3036635 RepID=UPI00261FC474|nr:hypothetical protein [Mastigocoleus sp. MO_188.B34]MDJ0696096.1 hypothetical protein [Mastigocoleus sp. MO_188.B34]